MPDAAPVEATGAFAKGWGHDAVTPAAPTHRLAGDDLKLKAGVRLQPLHEGIAQ